MPGSVPDYGGLASQIENYQDGGLCVWISWTYVTPRPGDAVCGIAPRRQGFLGGMRWGKGVSGAIDRHARALQWLAQYRDHQVRS